MGGRSARGTMKGIAAAVGRPPGGLEATLGHGELSPPEPLDDWSARMSSSAGSVGHRLYPGPEADSLSRRSWLDEGERGGKDGSGGGGPRSAWGGRGKVKISARDYCTHSSLHGLKYIAEKGRHPAERLFWALAFLGGLGLSGFFIGATWQRWNESPVLVSLDTLAAVLQDIPFPAVTVCNINKMKRSTVLQLLQTASADLLPPSPLLISSFMGLGSNLSQIAGEQGDLPTGPITGDEMKDFMTKATPSCGDMLRHCRFGGEPMDCVEIFKEVITDDGMCCAFNTLPSYVLNRQRDAEFEQGTEKEMINVWTPETGYPDGGKQSDEGHDRSEIPRRGAAPGVSGGLTLLLDAQVDDYYLPRSPSMGFKVLVHSPSEVPAVRELGLSVSPGAETVVAVRPVVVRSTPGIRVLPPQRRRCFLQSERRLAYFRLYSVSACRAECLANSTLKACGCKEYFMPGMSGSTENITENICSFYETVTCVKRIATKGGREHEACNCQPACSELSYEPEVSSARFPLPEDALGQPVLGTLRAFSRRDDDEYLLHVRSSEKILSPSELQKLKEKKKKELRSFLKNHALLHVFFKDFKVMRYKRAIMYDALDFLSNIGGLLGLCLGFSFLSGVEIIYFATLRMGLLGKRAT